MDCNILRAEFHYYHEINAMGFSTIPVETMRLEEGSHYPSLWLPRFDIVRNEQDQLVRLGMESVYSLLQKAPGTLLDHETTLRALINKITSSHMVQQQGYHFDIPGFVTEWVRRDLLNIIFGNSDNHGRNTAFVKAENQIMLSPVYDFAPMKADPEGIPRTLKWSLSCESGGIIISTLSHKRWRSGSLPQHYLMLCMKQPFSLLISRKGWRREAFPNR